MPNDRVVIYSYVKRPTSSFNLKYFVTNLRANIDYVFVLNGFECDVDIPRVSNVTILARENVGFDFASHTVALNFIKDRSYKYYFFMNCGVIGPILPAYMEDTDWSEIFISKLKGDVKLVSTTIAYTGIVEPYEDPKTMVEGFFFMTDSEGLSILQKEELFKIYINKWDVIRYCEFRTAEIMFKHGYNIDCMLGPYKGIDWRTDDKKVNNNMIPSTPGDFYGTSVLPYDVIFHKWYWPFVNKYTHQQVIIDHVLQRNLKITN